MSDHDHPEEMKKQPTRKRRAGRAVIGITGFITRLGLLLVVLAIGGFIGGFLQFTDTVRSATPPTPLESADGIVALTGGPARIAQALDLLAERKGKRLLISGVNPSTSQKAIERINPNRQALFRCCVDLERRALDTVGNAQEAAKWVTDNGYGSIILVTSAYHMPRSLTEFHRQLADVTVQAYPVPIEDIQKDGWWRDPGTLRFLLGEYVKFLGAKSRDYVNPTTLHALRATVFGA